MSKSRWATRSPSTRSVFELDRRTWPIDRRPVSRPVASEVTSSCSSLPKTPPGSVVNDARPHQRPVRREDDDPPVTRKVEAVAARERSGHLEAGVDLPEQRAGREIVDPDLGRIAHLRAVRGDEEQAACAEDAPGAWLSTVCIQRTVPRSASNAMS